MSYIENFAPEDFKVPGFKASGIACGIKKTGKKDLALIISEAPAQAAGLFTTNKVKAAPVLIGQYRIKKGTSRGVIVNSGNANACTGKQGYKAAEKMTILAEKALGFSKGSMLVSSTGVIGVPLPVERVEEGMQKLVEGLSVDGLNDATEAIMTTDAFPKRALVKGKVGGKTVTIAGMAKGAGMICPNMATMLAYFLTDANIKSATLKKAFKQAIDLSFNSIIVDNDTSTNDTALIFANGVSGGTEIKNNTADFKAFTKLLTEASVKLAKMIVKDGEGATRLIELDIRGAKSVNDARKAARTIAESMLVKTAFFGGDPNWGRIMGALGRAGISLDESKVDISFNGVPVVKKGLDTGKEAQAATAIKVKEIKVIVNLRSGSSEATIWTTDLSYEYVKINSAYRT
ncbi:MAG: bifunctional glutamate N-acetyltransferase/amino-acid acetyltransferase ArgJ [Deltaproteobacteria bacterium]|nr:bifunctional glutamate N-acetyltransferase/amino-acid acetyltransferase ArgJ [Deltaproteobacteria bacterium]